MPYVDAELLAPRLAHHSAPRTRTPVLRSSVQPQTGLLPGSWLAINVTSGAVAKQPNGLATIRWQPQFGNSLTGSGLAGLSLLKMQVRFGRRSGQAKENPGELPWPAPELGLCLESRHWVTK